MSQCEYCGPGSFANATTNSCNTCPIKTYSTGGTNESLSCPPGFYANELGSIACIPCKMEEEFSYELDRCSCKTGTFEHFDEDNILVCTVCPVGSRCDRPGISINNLPLEAMYYRISFESFILEVCPFKDACVGNVGRETETVCEVGYEGPLCAVCSSSYSAQGAGEELHCEKCDGDATATIAFWTAGFVSLLSLSVF